MFCQEMKLSLTFCAPCADCVVKLGEENVVLERFRKFLFIIRASCYLFTSPAAYKKLSFFKPHFFDFSHSSRDSSKLLFIR